jgi:hypothetical protein
MRMRSTVLSALVVLVLVPLAGATAEYSVRDFISAAPAVLFYTDDEMSEDEKRVLVKKGFKKRESFNCSEWGVERESKNLMVLKYCQDSEVSVRLFPVQGTASDVVVGVESSRASGRSVDLSWFKVSAGKSSFEPLTSDQLKQIGLEMLNENDFLAEPQRFPADQAEPAWLELTEEGTVGAFIHTWMDPRWEHRHKAFSITFNWDGSRFVKKVEPEAPER